MRLPHRSRAKAIKEGMHVKAWFGSAPALYPTSTICNYSGAPQSPAHRADGLFAGTEVRPSKGTEHSGACYAEG